MSDARSQYRDRLPRGNPNADPSMVIDPSDRTQDKNVRDDVLPRRNIEELKKGGKIKRTGIIKAHKGEQVIKKSSAQKYGPAKMAAVNKGSANVTTRPKGKR